jgi:hypothetical protein
MTLTSHKKYHVSKLQKVHCLLGLQRMLKEELADFSEGFELADSITEAVAMIASDDAEAKEPLDRHKHLAVPLMLDHLELGQHLIADGHFPVTIDAHMKAPFAIDKADDPVR